MESKRSNKAKSSAVKSLFKWGDIILLLVFIVAIVLTIVLATGQKSLYAEVYIDGKLTYTLNLSENQTLEILGGKMTLKVEDGKIYVLDSDCPEQLCVNSAPIGKDGGMIACLPNKVVIKTTSKRVDAIT